jgi:hypothetical protein
LKVEIEPDGHAALARYGDAATMDMADWLINLELRSLVARTGDAGLARFVRENPIIRRSDAHGIEFEPIRARLSPAACAILDNRQPPGGVQPLRVDEMYVFEQRLPAAIRDAGRAFVPGFPCGVDVPPEFAGPLDDAFDPPLLGRFARIDLSLPDDVLLREFKRYLAQQREQLARVAADAPFARAIDDIEHRYDPKPATWARLHVLALLDVQAWLAETGTHTTPGAIARALGLDARDHQQAVEYAKTLTNDFSLRGWLLSAASAALQTRL